MSQSDKNSIKLEQENEVGHQSRVITHLVHKQSYDNYNDGDNQNQQDQDQYEEGDDEQMNEQEQEQDQGEDNNNREDDQSQQNMVNTNNKKRSHKKLEISNFIMKTYKILEDKRNSSIVQWTDEGNCFIVKDKDKFSKQILPKYFKHSKFSSFVRQLNMYDFHKIRKEKQIPIFKHRYFQESRIDLLHKIKRKSGEDGKQDEVGSKQVIGISQANIESRIQISNQNLKQSTQLIPSTKSQIQSLKKQNLELHQSINQISQQIQFLQVNKEKKKEKLMKILTSIMFFDLNLKVDIPFEQIPNKYQDNQIGFNFMDSLRTLQEHFVRDQEPSSFTEYRKRLASIYSGLKANLIV